MKLLYGTDRIGGSAIESRIRASLKRGESEFVVPKRWVEANTADKANTKVARVAKLAKHYGYDLTPESVSGQDFHFRLGVPVVFVEPPVDLEGPIEGDEYFDQTPWGRDKVGALPDD